MNNAVIQYSMTAIILIIFFLFLAEHIRRKKHEKNIKEITKQLTRILDSDSEEKVMSFTESKDMKDLICQTNRMLEDRQKMKADYKRAEIASKKMLSNVSHDIKTPLTVILGYLEILISKPGEQTETLMKIQKKASQLMELINTFFTLSKIEAGDTDLTISKIPVNEICRQNIVDFYNILTEKEFHVDISRPDNNIMVFGNEEALNRILYNLITNAVRYGSDGKYIGIEVREEDEKVFIDVTDKGKGIGREEQKHVFDRLYTLDDSRNKHMGGNGLGLTIAKSLALKMEGDIVLHSIPYEKTTFTLTLNKFPY